MEVLSENSTMERSTKLHLFVVIEYSQHTTPWGILKQVSNEANVTTSKHIIVDFLSHGKEVIYSQNGYLYIFCE